MGLLDNLNFSQPFRISSLLPSEAQLQAFKQKSDAEALAQFSQDPNPIRRVPFNILTALGVNPTIAQAAPTTLDVAPVTGDISALADARTAFGQGDLATAGLLAAATILPGVPAGKVKGLLKGGKSDNLTDMVSDELDPPNIREKDDYLVKIPVENIKHGESALPGGKLTFPNSQQVIENFARRKSDLPPISVISNDDGTAFVADGSHRLEAAKLKGDKFIKAFVKEDDLKNIDGLEILDNPEK